MSRGPQRTWLAIPDSAGWAVGRAARSRVDEEGSAGVRDDVGVGRVKVEVVVEGGKMGRRAVRRVNVRMADLGGVS